MIPPLKRLDASILQPVTPKPLSAKDAHGRPIVFAAPLPEEVPNWARLLLDASNRNADAIEALARAQKNLHKVLEFATKDPVEDTFPMFVALADKPAGMHIIRPRNTDDLTALFYVYTGVDWTMADGGVYVRFISGLEPLTRYSLTLEVIYA